MKLIDSTIQNTLMYGAKTFTYVGVHHKAFTSTHVYHDHL